MSPSIIVFYLIFLTNFVFSVSVQSSFDIQEFVTVLGSYLIIPFFPI